MDPLINKILKKRNIDDISSLDSDEKTELDRWQRILSEGEITVDSLKKFCVNQLNLIEQQQGNLDNSNQKNERLVVLHIVYRTLLKVMNAPQAERENLEKYLNQLLKT